MAIIDKALALEIARKLRADFTQRKGKRHDIASVYLGGKMVASFGIRRGSRKGLGHDHVPSQIFLTPHEARLLGECPMSRDEWVDKLRDKGKI